LLGIDTKPIQQQQAAQALPKLLQSMQPTPETANLTSPAISANLPPINGVPNNLNVPAMSAPYDTGKMLPGMNIGDALAKSGSPELQSEYAPQLLQSIISQQAKANEPYTLDAGAHRFIGTQDIASAPTKPEATPDIVQIAQTLFPNDPQSQHAYIIKNSPANLRAITNINNPKQNWQILTDPKSNTQFRYDLDSGKAFTLDGKPFTPGGAQKLSSNQARSPAAIYLQKYQAEHPGATSDDLATVAATFGAQQKAVKDFATGPEGNIITRINTAVSHLDTLQKVGEAMDNGDVQAYNKLRNIWRTQFGSELPTNFNAAMPIVAGEVSKAVVGTQGGTREDRAELEASLQDAASRRQLAGATGTQKALLQGQLQSRRRQYEVSTGRTDFDKFLSGDTQRELGVTTAPTSQAAPPQQQATPVKIRVYNPATGKLE
jgi:hypothetical protein